MFVTLSNCWERDEKQRADKHGLFEKKSHLWILEQTESRVQTEVYQTQLVGANQMYGHFGKGLHLLLRQTEETRGTRGLPYGGLVQVTDATGRRWRLGLGRGRRSGLNWAGHGGKFPVAIPFLHISTVSALVSHEDKLTTVVALSRVPSRGRGGNEAKEEWPMAMVARIEARKMYDYRGKYHSNYCRHRLGRQQTNFSQG